MANENKTTSGVQESENNSSILSRIMGFFRRNLQKKGNTDNRLTKAFNLTRKESISLVIIAIAVVCGAVYYGSVVIDEYQEINNRADELKNLSGYNISPNTNRLSLYKNDNDINTINGMISINKTIEQEIANNEITKQKQKGYYEVLLQNIYLPSLNIWKDPYTKVFNMGILGQEYLERDKFQDLYLIQHWSDFIKYVGNDADYNKIDSLTIGDKVVLEGNPEYFYIPITVSFSSPNKRSFLLLVNKLSMTSNQNNIALLNEFFFHLLNYIREEKEDIINQLAEDYREEFSSSSNWEFDKDMSKLSTGEMSIYRDRVIGYNLYHRINSDLTGENTSQLIDDDIIVKTIKKVSYCSDEAEFNQTCFYNFREKYRNLPYLAYKIGLEKQANRTNGLLEFLQDLPPAIAITSFGFEKYSDSSFLNNKEEEYEGKVSFNVYGRNITDSELEEASSMLGKLCFGSVSEQKITPEVALSYVNQAIALMGGNINEDSLPGGNQESSNVFLLGELQGLFTDMQNSYNDMSNYEKMAKLFEIWRMMNDANLCNK